MRKIDEVEDKLEGLRSRPAQGLEEPSHWIIITCEK